MNFFEHQDRARKRTTRLVLLFALAVVMILAAVNAAALGIMRILLPHISYVRDAAPVFREDREYPGHLTPVRPLWQEPRWYVLVSGCTILIIAGGSLYKSAALSRGGAALAQLLGGRPLLLDSPNANDQMLRNVVEEMSIASGVPVPAVYVMEDEPGINAFAAGFTTRDAVIGVTRGCIEKLNRDELQGVIAHEFSHILNGDMRLNLRLIGILHGILVIALIGYGILRSFGRVRFRGGGKDGGGAAVVVLVMALSAVALLVIGYVGVFFGRLIQAAVSRQREFLADASAVQFTRNPAGLVGALRKIGADAAGSHIDNHNALEAAHMFFGSAGKFSLLRLMATHPPLEERIRALDPMFDERFAPAPAVPTPMHAGVMGLADAQRIPVQPESFVRRAGSPDRPDIRFAERLVTSFPDEIRLLAREPFGARAIVFALLMSDDPPTSARQLEVVRQNVEAVCYEYTTRLIAPIAQLGARARLPLIDLALPPLRAMSPPQIAQFRAIVRALIEADARISLFEFALFRILVQNLRPPDLSARRPVQFHAIGAVIDEASMVLSALASASSRDSSAAYAAGASRLDPTRASAMPEVGNLKSLASALETLSLASGAVKQRVIDAAAHVVAADGEVAVAEAELLRAVAATLDVPIPPIISN